MADETKSDKMTLEELHIGNDRRLAKLMIANESSLTQNSKRN
jgi:hypothetical protein